MAITSHLREGVHLQLTEARNFCSETESSCSDLRRRLEECARSRKPERAGDGVAGRYHLLPGDAFETDFGSGYDLVLIPNFLHHFGPPTCTTFMRKVHSALEPGGRAAIAEFVPNSDRVAPPMPAAFSMMMLANTPSGDAYTFAELENISKDPGFARVELAPTEIGLNRLVIVYR
jgi:hypothetical protein